MPYPHKGSSSGWTLCVAACVFASALLASALRPSACAVYPTNKIPEFYLITILYYIMLDGDCFG